MAGSVRRVKRFSFYLSPTHPLTWCLYSQAKTSRVAIVPDIETAVDALFTIANALKPERRKRKKQYIAKVQEEYYIPDDSGIIHKPGSAATVVSVVLQSWAREFGLPENEENVLMADLHTLGLIATANDAQLQSVPIESKTKAVLHSFFGSQGAMDGYVGHRRSHKDAHLSFPEMTPRDSQPLLPMAASHRSPMAAHPIASLRSMPAARTNYESHQPQPMAYAPANQDSHMEHGMAQQNPGHYRPNGAGPPVPSSFGNNQYDVGTAPPSAGRFQMHPQRLQQTFHYQQPGAYRSNPNNYGARSSQHFGNGHEYPPHQPRQMLQQRFQQQQLQPIEPMESDYDQQMQPGQYGRQQMMQQQPQYQQMRPGALGPNNAMFGGIRRFH